MAKLTKEQLERILTTRLSLEDPQFFLQKAGGRLVGNIVSPSFKGKRDYGRQTMIWNALDEELGAESAILVGMLLPTRQTNGISARTTTRQREKQKRLDNS
jgi:stress-induced morphogen